ncbi:uncharacterized protein LOC124915826 [Impatiens glandulifera]|uniref:uncharacterized protein LOC124915826 n=1 Tax=Impatiens glandulifera TaxID=253017 RepID=UPI001FB0CA50|nr:uncharacterized protein LOC124915826 [Impatiens glandulifera]
MAASSNRSPSPTPNRQQNPSSRILEQSPIARRSFIGSPFSRPSILSNPKTFCPITPANSPSSDLTGRNSFGLCSRTFEDKENDTDQSFKQGKVRSPAISKGSKHFMAPTISAASKFTPSPRKKVLGERNENSFSFSSYMEKVSESVETKSEMGSHDSEAQNLNQKEAHFESVPPPYDPITNYLSPRPQFLRYKPNQRIRSHLRKGNEEINSFELDNLSTEGTESEDSKKESCEEEDSSAVVIETETGLQGEEEEEESESKRVPKSSFFSRFRFISFFMLLAIGILSLSVTVTDSPSIFHGSIVLSNTSMPNLNNPFEFQEDFNEFVRNFMDWSSNYMSHVFKPRTIALDKQPDTFQFHNMTSFQEFALINDEESVKQHIQLDFGNQIETETNRVEEIENEGFDFESSNDKEGEIEAEMIEEVKNLEISDEEEEEDSLHQNEEQSDKNDAIEYESGTSSAVDDELVLIQEILSSSSLESCEILPSDITIAKEEEPETIVSSEGKGVHQNEISSDEDKLVQEVDSSSVGDVQTSKALSSSFDQQKKHIMTAILVLVAVILVPASIFFYLNHHHHQKKITTVQSQCQSHVSSSSNSFEEKKKRGKKSDSSSLMSSSSTESPSYGSFTTYKKIPIKNNGFDEEILTPVRRSSRIRKPIILDNVN